MEKPGLNNFFAKKLRSAKKRCFGFIENFLRAGGRCPMLILLAPKKAAPPVYLITFPSTSFAVRVVSLDAWIRHLRNCIRNTASHGHRFWTPPRHHTRNCITVMPPRVPDPTSDSKPLPERCNCKFKTSFCFAPNAANMRAPTQIPKQGAVVIRRSRLPLLSLLKDIFGLPCSVQLCRIKPLALESLDFQL